MMFSIIDDMDRRERDYSIDFVKGVAILFVIFLYKDTTKKWNTEE